MANKLSTPGINLDSPPPPSSTPSLGGLAGQSQQPSPGGSSQVVMEHMMEVEKLLGRIADIRPEAAPIVDNIVQQMRARLGKALMQDPSQSTGSPSIAGLVASAAAPATPTS